MVRPTVPIELGNEPSRVGFVDPTTMSLRLPRTNLAAAQSEYKSWFRRSDRRSH